MEGAALPDTVEVQPETAAAEAAPAPSLVEAPPPPLPPPPPGSMQSAFGSAFSRILGAQAAGKKQPWFVDIREDPEAAAAYAALPPAVRGAYAREGFGQGGNVVQEAWTKAEAVAIVSRKTGVPLELLEAIGSS